MNAAKIAVFIFYCQTRGMARYDGLPSTTLCLLFLTPNMPNQQHHTLFDDLQGLFAGVLFMAFAIALFQAAGLLTGGATGIAFLIHYATDWPLGPILFIVNLPFYIFSFRAMGLIFTVKTFCAVFLLSICTGWTPSLIRIGYIDPVFAAIMGGLFAGVGILMLIRHHSSFGGVGVLAIYLQQSKGWRAGWIQMSMDVAILATALLVVNFQQVMISILAALSVNFVIALNHRPGRYFGA